MIPTRKELKASIAAAISVGVLEVSHSHIYTIGGQIFQQLDGMGGGIGLRLASVVARIRMRRWLRIVKFHFLRAGMKIWLIYYYVDDIRLVMSPLPRDWRWSANKGPQGMMWKGGTWAPSCIEDKAGSLVYEQQWEVKDSDDETDRPAKQVKLMMNSVDKDMTFSIALACPMTIPRPFQFGQVEL